jgi:hypothetical protein
MATVTYFVAIPFRLSKTGRSLPANLRNAETVVRRRAWQRSDARAVNRLLTIVAATFPTPFRGTRRNGIPEPAHRRATGGHE